MEGKGREEERKGKEREDTEEEEREEMVHIAGRQTPELPQM